MTSENTVRTTPPNHQGRRSGAGNQLQFPGDLHQRGPHMVTQFLCPLLLYFLRLLKKNNLSAELLRAFYLCSIQSVLTYCITSWYVNGTEADRKSLRRVIRTSEKIIGLSLPSLEDIFRTRCLRSTTNILKDETHPCHHLFSLLPSGRRYRALIARNSRLKNSFFHRAITELNNTRQAGQMG